MTAEKHRDPIDLLRDGPAIDAAMSAAAREAALRHKQLGVPLVVWRDGRIVEIPPEQIAVSDPKADRSS